MDMSDSGSDSSDCILTHEAPRYKHSMFYSNRENTEWVNFKPSNRFTMVDFPPCEAGGRFLITEIHSDPRKMNIQLTTETSTLERIHTRELTDMIVIQHERVQRIHKLEKEIASQKKNIEDKTARLGEGGKGSLSRSDDDRKIFEDDYQREIVAANQNQDSENKKMDLEYNTSENESVEDEKTEELSKKRKKPHSPVHGLEESDTTNYMFPEGLSEEETRDLHQCITESSTLIDRYARELYAHKKNPVRLNRKTLTTTTTYTLTRGAPVLVKWHDNVTYTLVLLNINEGKFTPKPEKTEARPITGYEQTFNIRAYNKEETQQTPSTQLLTINDNTPGMFVYDDLITDEKVYKCFTSNEIIRIYEKEYIAVIESIQCGQGVMQVLKLQRVDPIVEAEEHMVVTYTLTPFRMYTFGTTGGRDMRATVFFHPPCTGIEIAAEDVNVEKKMETTSVQLYLKDFEICTCAIDDDCKKRHE